MEADLTSPTYWNARQSKLKAPKDRGAFKDLLDSIAPFLQEYKGQRWLEIGCSPGHMSALLYKRVPFIPFGVDSSPSSYLYTDTMSRFANVKAELFQLDLRDFIASQPFDVVMSFGLIEHFANPQEILDHHYRCCRKGGLLVVTIPHFRYLQWVYHYLFDRKDLARHNVAMMNLETLHVFAERKNLEVCFLGHVGRLNFSNFDRTGSRLAVYFRMGLSVGLRLVTNGVLSHLLPADQKFYAPWIVFVGRKT